MKKQTKREAMAKDDCSTERAGTAFPASVILSIVTGIQLCEDRSEVVEFLEYLHSKEISGDAAQKAAIAPAVEWIVSHLPWTVQAASSIKRSKTDVASWLARQIARHGAIHSLPPMPTKAAMVGLQPLWMKLNNEACDAVGELMNLAKSGDENARQALLSLALGLTRHLHKNHSELIPLCDEFLIPLSADLETRGQQLEAARFLPIGKACGFLQARVGVKSPATDKQSPAYFWISIQGRITVIRDYVLIDSECAKTEGLAADGKLLKSISKLSDFGTSHAKDLEWLSVAKLLVEANPELLIPTWITNRVTSGAKQTKQRGNPWQSELEKGFNYCVRK